MVVVTDLVEAIEGDEVGVSFKNYINLNNI